MTNTEVTRSTESPKRERVLTPLFDVYESAEDYLLVADLPGVALESLTLNLEANELAVEGRVLSEGDTAFKYQRSFRVPKSVEVEKIAATLRDGELQLRLPKRDAVKPRRIFVKAG